MSDAEHLLQSLAKKSADSEFFSPIPERYKIGKTKYVVVFGTVMSGLGKGIFSSSLAKLLQMNGLKVAPIKFDGYLNVDAGTLNPYRHGEVFVLDDGLECDMDLGTYERFLNLNLTEKNYLTGGKIFTNVLSRERAGKYLGRDVQFIPHVTGYIKQFLRELAMQSSADLVFVEVGGTVGDVENGYFIEAMRELAYEEGKQNVCFVALTYILEPKFLGEQKTKAAQLGIGSLLSAGIQPDIVACRSSNPITDKVKEKISLYSNVPLQRVIGVHDCKSIYTIPFLLEEGNIDSEVMRILGLKGKKVKQQHQQWKGFIRSVDAPKKRITVGITGKYTGLRDSYASVINALEHAAAAENAAVDITWIDTTEEHKMKEMLKGADGIIVPGGFGKRGIEGKLAAAGYCRENNIPYLGLCLGFQIAVIEFARNVCKLDDANSTEMENKPRHAVIDMLPEQKKIEGLGGNMRLGGKNVEVKEGTLAYRLYGNKPAIRERFRHRYECNPDYIATLEKHGMVFSGKAPNQPIMQILELPKHKYFIASQYHAEFTSRPLSPNPLFMGFVKACLK